VTHRDYPGASHWLPVVSTESSIS